VGFCIGGLMAYLTAARHYPDAAVAYHGGDTEKYLGEAQDISAPLMMHLAEEDEFISKNAQAQIKAAFSDVTGANIFSYPGCHHAFARHNDFHYDAHAAELANGRTEAFLAKYLNYCKSTPKSFLSNEEHNNGQAKYRVCPRPLGRRLMFQQIDPDPSGRGP
jgi:carboxymethylenebutenolidase